MSKGIENCDHIGRLHGYNEKYYEDGKLLMKGNFVNGNRRGIYEAYYYDGTLALKGFYKNRRILGLHKVFIAE